MNCEFEVVGILRREISPEQRAKLIMKFADFKEEDIIAAINKGGKTHSDIYRTLTKLDEKSNEKK